MDSNAPKLPCSRCRRDLEGLPVERTKRGQVIRCVCGLETRVINAPRPPEKHNGPRMSKKERKRQRAKFRERIVQEGEKSHPGHEGPLPELAQGELL